jgi:preprotein translocase subunit SecY
MIFPTLKELYQEEGEAGRRKFNQYSRLLTVPLAIFQGFGLLALLARSGVLINLTAMDRVTNIAIVVAGTMLLTWIGELISEYGIGNGVSLLIFAGIVARVPSSIAQIYTTFTPDQLPIYLAFIVASIVIIAGIVLITEAERPIPMTYAKQVRGNKMFGGSSTYLPIRLNNAGVMPIIFALSILLFPQMIVNFFGTSATGLWGSFIEVLRFITTNVWVHGALYFLFVFAFTFFYSAVTFDPEAIATNLQKSGAFVPGVRPGRSTAEFLGKTLYRLTLIGAIFLGVIAILPTIFQSWTGISTLAIGGTSILIVVSVAIDFIKQLEAQASMREY